MPNAEWRIISDIHYGDHSSRVLKLTQIEPLFEGADRMLLNGDTVDTRPGPFPHRTSELRAETIAFLARCAPNGLILTGNHDPDFTANHFADLAEGAVFVTHGDVLFESVVPWSRDASRLRPRIRAGLAALGPSGQTLEAVLAVFRREAANLPQRHHSEPNRWKYLRGFIADTVWPPGRGLQILRTWHRAPELAAAFARTHRPQARFVLMGHLHRPGLRRTRDGRWIINTGSFCRPLGAAAIELAGGVLTLRGIDRRRGEFRLGGIRAQFALADGRQLATTDRHGDGVRLVA